MSQHGQCITCGKWKNNRSLIGYMCRDCRQLYSENMNSEWYLKLCDSEREWRRLNKREDRADVVTLSELLVYADGQLYDGYDMIDGEIGFPGRRKEKLVMEDSNNFSSLLETASPYSQKEILEIWCEFASLTEAESNAIMIRYMVYDGQKIPSRIIADLLSEYEDKNVTSSAYRRRLSNARKKLKALFQHQQS